MPKEKFDITGCKSTSCNLREVNMCKTCRKLRNLSGLQNGGQDCSSYARRHMSTNNSQTNIHLAATGMGC